MTGFTFHFPEALWFLKTVSRKCELVEPADVEGAIGR